MKPFRFGILGAARIAESFCRAVAEVESCVVAAVASKSPERAAAFAEKNGVPAHYGDYGEMLDREKPDCAYIAVTNNAHFELTMLCLERGVPVLCEKAMFTGSGEAERALALAREKGLFAMEALWSRFLPALNTARRWLEDGRIGDVLYAESAIGFVAPEGDDNRYYSPALGGGAACDITVYGYEILTWLLRRPVERVSVEAVRSHTGVDLTDVALLRLAGNVPAVVRTSFAFAPEEQMVVYGTKGRIVVPHPHYASEAALYDAGGAELERFREEVDPDRARSGFVREIEESIRCIREGRVESSVVPHADTLDCARLIDRIRSAIEA